MQDVFDALRSILAPHAARLVVTVDEPAHYSLDTPHVMPNGRTLWFGAVRLGKRYVSYHLMPIYVERTLSASIGDALAKRRQGKACFNFRHRDETLFAELAALTERGIDEYARRGYLD